MRNYVSLKLQDYIPRIFIYRKDGPENPIGPIFQALNLIYDSAKKITGIKKFYWISDEFKKPKNFATF